MKKCVFQLFVVLMFVFNIAGVAFAKEASIIAEGSTTVLPLAQKTAEVFMNDNPTIDVSIRGGGSGVGINSLLSGRCDIASSSRELKQSELDKARQNNITPKAYIIAMDAIVIIVNAGNKVSNLSKQQILDIFTGKITNWKEVGGADKKIVIVSRDSASGTFETFNELALNNQRVAKTALMQASNQGVATIVSNTQGAIGYVGLGYLSAKIKPVSIDNILPSISTVLSKKYIYSRPLYMYTNGKESPNTKKYLAFILSKQGQQIAKELGFAPVR